MLTIPWATPANIPAGSTLCQVSRLLAGRCRMIRVRVHGHSYIPGTESSGIHPRIR